MGSYPIQEMGFSSWITSSFWCSKARESTQTQCRAKKSAMSIEEWSQNFTAHWDFPGETTKGHHAMFPMELPRRLIRMFSFPNERVLDPFAGQEPPVAAALEQGRARRRHRTESFVEEPFDAPGVIRGGAFLWRDMVVHCPNRTCTQCFWQRHNTPGCGTGSMGGHRSC